MDSCIHHAVTSSSQAAPAPEGHPPLHTCSQPGVVARRRSAAADGKKRQTVQFLNPINEKALNFMAVDAMDYPCSNMKEFETICTVTKSFLQALVSKLHVEVSISRALRPCSYASASVAGHQYLPQHQKHVQCRPPHAHQAGCSSSVKSKKHHGMPLSCSQHVSSRPPHASARVVDTWAPHLPAPAAGR